MFLAEPQKTPYDLKFPIAGISVRVSPWFWAVAAFLGWDWASVMSQGLGTSRLAVLAMWILAVLVSILIHELGHSLAMRYYGTDSRIVLYHFGGLAIPQGSEWVGNYQHQSRAKDIVISAAGPAAQLLLVAVLVMVVRLFGYQYPYPIPVIDGLVNFGADRRIESGHLVVMIVFITVPSIYWAILNLLPVYPLDGGQIAREIFLIFNSQTGIKNSLILSIATGAGIAVYAFSQGNQMLGIMLALLAVSSYQTLQLYLRQGGGGFGGDNSW